MSTVSTKQQSTLSSVHLRYWMFWSMLSEYACFFSFFLSVAILFSKKNISTLQPRIYVSFHIYLQSATQCVPQHLARFVVLVCVTVKRPGHES